jgi:hypothetical protein
MEHENWKVIQDLAQELLQITLNTPIGSLEIGDREVLYDLSIKEREIWTWYQRREFLKHKIQQLSIMNECGKLE